MKCQHVFFYNNRKLLTWAFHNFSLNKENNFISFWNVLWFLKCFSCCNFKVLKVNLTWFVIEISNVVNKRFSNHPILIICICTRFFFNRYITCYSIYRYNTLNHTIYLEYTIIVYSLFHTCTNTINSYLNKHQNK